MSGGKRSFARELSDTSAAQIRSQVSAAFSSEFTDTTAPLSGPVSSLESSFIMSAIASGLHGVALMPQLHTVSSQVSMELADPIDYEKFISENSKILEEDPHREMLVVPEDDVSVTTLPRKFRTVEIPVPGNAKRTDDPLVRDCVRSFTHDWNVVNRKYGSFHGQDTNILSRRFSTCQRTPEYTKQLPKHEYEVDSPMDMSIPEEEKKRYRQSITSNVDYNLDQAESDTLLLDLLDEHDEMEVDRENLRSRSENRHPSLFGLYPLPNREEAKENRLPAPPPAEAQGLKLHVKVSELRFDLNIEPIFAVMALYDAKEKKKISESFHLDCNHSDITHMLDDHVMERCMASLSRSAIFNISYPNPDVFLIVKIEKVLQQGDISEAVEPYLKARDLDKKTLEKHKLSASYFCHQLGQYRMPFAWTAINVLDIIAGNQSSSGMSGAGSESRESTLERRKSEVNPDKRGGTPEPGRRRDTRSNSISSTSSRSTSDESQASIDANNAIAQISQNFRPVTLTVNVFFKQESDKLSDEDLFRHLTEMKKSNSILNRKFRSIPGNLKVDISAPYDNMPCCLTSNLWELEPFPDGRTRRPTREIEEFPPREVYTPYTSYKNMLYIYPQALDFRSGKGRNVGVKVEFMAGEDREDALPCIYGKSCSPMYQREAWCPVLYHNKQPECYEEVKIELPPKITEKHHLLFTFYQISCQKPRPGEPMIQEPAFLGCSWIPMLQHNKIQLGNFHLCITADHPPPAYSQISTDTALPSLKWVDGHKPVFKVTVSMVSSIHPQDPRIEEFTNRFYEFHNVLGSEQQEKQLGYSMSQLQEADPERVVQFLHILLTNLCALLVRPCVTGESADIPPKAFEAIIRMVNMVHSLGLVMDKHNRNIILSSYIQYVFTTPLGQHPAHAFNRSATMQGKTRGSSSSIEDDAYAQSVEKGGSMRTAKKRVGFSGMADPAAEEVDGRRSSASSLQKVFHEEFVLQWIVLHPNLRVLILGNAWFFFQILIKSMSQYLARKGMLNTPRKGRFSVKFMKDLESLVGLVSTDITEKHIKDGLYARRLNISLAFFIHDSLSLMDRGFVFSLIKCYLKKFQLSIKDLNLTEFRLDFLRIVCSHEHLVTLNLPLGAALYPAGPGSQHSSPSSSISSTLENLDAPNVEAMGELSTEFRTYHYLSGLVLTELALVLDGKSSKLREQAIEVVRDLLASHDSDARYNKLSARARIASLYLPLLSIVMDNYQYLYKGADGWEDWSTTFERNASVRRSVVVKEGADGGWDIDGQEPPETQTNEHLLGPISTRNLLICFLWVLKNIDKELLKSWWSQLSISRFNILMNVLDLSVACFEYRPGFGSSPGSSDANASSLQGKINLQNQASTGTPTANTSGNRMRSQLANAILGGEGTAREMLARRKRERGAVQQSDALRWGKTYWQATSEQAERPVVDLEVDACIEGSLAAESSLIVLDTMELLMQTISSRENLHSTLGRALEVLLHLMGTNQSVQVMKDVFSTQRAIVWKFPDLLFFEETEQCAEMCRRLLRHCSSGVKNIRTWACASLYLLMRHDFEMENSFARVKVQATVALSSIVAGSTAFNEHHLRRSLKTLMSYAEEDSAMEDSTFPEQVCELSINLHHILLDTVKMQEFQDDPEMLMDLMYRISKGYKNSPDLRLTWLEAMAEKNSQVKNHTEAAMCLVHAAALVSEYLYLLEGKSYLPSGCVAFQNISPNVLEESATSEDTLAPEEEGICTGKLFSEQGLIGLMEQAAALFKEAQLYEAMNEVYRLIMPIYEARRAYQSLEKVHKSLSDCYQQLLHKGSHRFLGTYFRVGFYGLIFGDLDRQEFIYKEAALAHLGEFSLRLQTLYSEKMGKDKIEILKESKTIDPSTLNPAKGHIQITFVEPYFEEWELKDRQSVFERAFNIRRFVFNTPYTKGGKPHGEIHEQCMSKTILTTNDMFPYVKKRSKVINWEKLDMSPLQVAIIGMQEKINSLRKCLLMHPTDSKLLQMLLQGGIATAVNQGPFAIAKCFLDIPLSEQTHDHRRLRVCFKEFTRRCQEALDLNKQLITEEQHEYQHELVRNLREFQNKLEPMVPTKKKHKRSRDRALRNISATRTSRTFSAGD